MMDPAPPPLPEFQVATQVVADRMPTASASGTGSMAPQYAFPLQPNSHSRQDSASTIGRRMSSRSSVITNTKVHSVGPRSHTTPSVPRGASTGTQSRANRGSVAASTRPSTTGSAFTEGGEYIIAISRGKSKFKVAILKVARAQCLAQVQAWRWDSLPSISTLVR
jgi:hypothetical protein